ncbi:MAG: TIGR00269 family protein [Candidatus Atribacteria bacterium]|nr:TIGR00269 family protein [Candidatus Atribacteria bacterium]MCD6350154.1 TIGR00269 family protein [Candidatus Atribacteria bacterium]
MKCTRCKKEAVMKLKRHNSAFCPECFDLFFSRQVEQAIKKNRMFNKEETVLLGVSGGKDSMSLWFYLQQAGYKVQAIHFDLGIREYSLRSRKIVEDFSAKHQFPLEVVEVKSLIKYSIPEITQKVRNRPSCSVCGMIKRHLLNRYAWDNRFSVYATGHNLDDEAAALLGNILHWQDGYLAHQSPVLPSLHPKMVRKVKPFYTLTEEEIHWYAKLHDIPFIEERCPLSKRAKSFQYKEALNFLEEKSPGTKHMFLLGFLERRDKYFAGNQEEVKLTECSRCGMPTTLEVCSFCRLMERLNSQGERRE